MSNSDQIAERTIKFSLRIIELYRHIKSINDVGKIIGKQLLRSATSIGANVHEAQGAQSKADFISKMSIAQKEALESIYWLRLISESQLVNQERLTGIVDETQQIVKIISAILVTSKKPTRQVNILNFTLCTLHCTRSYLPNGGNCNISIKLLT